MQLIDQLASLELCKKLKELNVKQKSLFYWNDIDDNNEEGHPINRIELLNYPFLSNYCTPYSAFTVAELGEMLPDKIKDDDEEICWFYHDKNNGCHRISYVHSCDEQCSPFIEVKGETEANARAKLLIHLLENGLMEFPE